MEPKECAYCHGMLEDADYSKLHKFWFSFKEDTQGLYCCEKCLKTLDFAPGCVTFFLDFDKPN